MSCRPRRFTDFPHRSYAEVLENTQFSLIATIHKLYAMVRDGQPWELGEPELNDRGQPVIHDIAQKLGCIRPHSDLDLPVSHIFPEDEASLSELAVALEKHHKEREPASASATCPSSPTDKHSPPNHHHHHHHHHHQQSPGSTAVSSPQLVHHHHEPDRQPAEQYQRCDSASSSELEYSDLDTDYRKTVFCRLNPSAQLAKGTPPSCPSPSVTMSPSACSSALAPMLSPQSLTYDLDVSSACSDLESAGPIVGAPPPLFPGSAPHVVASSYPADAAVAVASARPATVEFTPEQVIQLTTAAPGCCGGGGDGGPAAVMIDVDDMLNQGLLETDLGRLKPPLLSPQVMMGVGDPMIFGGGSMFEAESLNM